MGKTTKRINRRAGRELRAILNKTLHGNFIKRPQFEHNGKLIASGGFSSHLNFKTGSEVMLKDQKLFATLRSIVSDGKNVHGDRRWIASISVDGEPGLKRVVFDALEVHNPVPRWMGTWQVGDRCTKKGSPNDRGVIVSAEPLSVQWDHAANVPESVTKESLIKIHTIPFEDLLY